MCYGLVMLIKDLLLTACRFLVRCVVFGLLLSAGPVAAQTNPDSDTTDADAVFLHPAVTSYAREYSVSFEVAEKNLRRIDELAEIKSLIIGLEHLRVAGLGTDHGMDMRGWVWLVGDQPASAKAAQIADAHDDMEIRLGATHTYAELRNAQNSLEFDCVAGPETNARLSDVVVYTDVNVRANSVEVGIDPAGAFTRARRSTSTARASDEEFAAEGDWVTSMLKGFVDAPILIGDGRVLASLDNSIGGEEMGTAIPGRPGNVGVTIGPRYVRVGWSAPSAGATKYTVYRRIAGGIDEYTEIATTSDVYFYDLVAGLEPGTEYHYRVKAVNEFGDTEPWSNHGSITTHAQPGRPTDVGVTIGPRYVRVGWSAPSDGATKYAILRRIAGGIDEYTEIATTSDIYFYELVAGLEPGTEYHYRVKAVNKLGVTGPWSNYGSITTPVLTEVPGRPTDVGVTIGPRYVRVGWSAPSTGATQYTVYRRIAEGIDEFTEIATTSDIYFYELVAGLEPGTEYCYRVKAVNNFGDTGPWSSNGAVTTPKQ